MVTFINILSLFAFNITAHWLKNNVIEAEKLYHCVAMIFNIWSKSQFFRREEQNFISSNEIDNMALIMPSSGRGGRITSATKSEAQVATSRKVTTICNL